ncbi:hypothetical protein pdul_cds_674 [Pandoravirus dulcis]|uniref:Transcription factor zinc-finger domain-containing protein n=1 Tax=Pandoravirus dulcis TaxID=1349409 RepID=S4VY53_9VIRU|nr:hypothetical protein pdul_cds_674 [Pandoravirus dulcis]AGO82824.1 hypothetical protein pdul_cds_674 [Pandoravirus dulcis]
MPRGFSVIAPEEAKQRIDHRQKCEHSQACPLSPMASSAECPVCQYDDRAFYMVPNNNIVLMCNGCTSIWLDPARPGWGEPADDQALCDRFGVSDVDQLFNGTDHWATRREVLQDRKWRDALDRIGHAKDDP